MCSLHHRPRDRYLQSTARHPGDHSHMRLTSARKVRSMYYPHDDRGAMSTDQFDRLTRDIQLLSFGSPEHILTRICAGLMTMEPIRAAGLFRFEEMSEDLHWIALNPVDDNLMLRSLVQDRSNLVNLLVNENSQVQRQIADRSYFVGTPAGTFDGAPLGLGVSTDRSLKDDEIGRLNSFSMIAGLMAENSRLQSLVSDDDEAGSTARLLGFVAHELRTPLTGMRGNIQLALMAIRKGQHERIPDRLEAAISSVDDMSGLVQKLLDVSRLERGAFPLTLGTGKIGDTINQAVTSFLDQPDSDLDHIPISGDIDIMFDHDQQAMQDTLCFLLNNIKPYLRDRAGPAITVFDDGVLIRIQIAYAGTELAGDDLAALSVPLSSTRPSSQRSDHLSLDLAFCRGVIRRHNGEIMLHADTPAPGHHMIDILLPH